MYIVFLICLVNGASVELRLLYIDDLVNEMLDIDVYKRQIQVLAPMYQGVAGIDALNDALQDVFNPKDQCLDSYKIGRIEYRRCV